jgi:hypothetical protein
VKKLTSLLIVLSFMLASYGCWESERRHDYRDGEHHKSMNVTTIRTAMKKRTTDMIATVTKTTTKKETTTSGSHSRDKKYPLSGLFQKAAGPSLLWYFMPF